ncbi:MAG: alpha/beta fold hydrolase [Cyanobacteria bacterium P01_E01_bin.43]
MTNSPQNPILLVPGIDDTARIFDKMVAYLGDRGWSAIHPLNLQPSNGNVGLDHLAQQVQQYVDCHLADADAIDIVGFSMGGMVSRYYIQRFGGWRRVQRFVTLSAPHNGTWTGYLRQNPGASQMRPNSAFLQDLNQTMDELQQVEFTSIWTPYDLMIVPANSSQLAVGRMIQLPVLGHPLMVTDARSLATIGDILSRQTAPQPASV